MTFEPGAMLDRYLIEALVGEGAMGKVYRAFDPRLERSVAIKVLEPVASEDAGEAVASALREARAAAAILHPNATAIFDADRSGETAFIVMELVPGTSLRAFVGDLSVPLGTRARWLVEIGGALAAAHRAGVVHRDVKPENVIVRDDGLVKVLDFGIARLPRGDATGYVTLSSQGGLVGTPAYMAPEQIRGEDIDGHADQFGWGVLAYELLTGRLPWEHPEDPIAQLAAVLTAQPAPIAAAAAVPADIASVVLRALAKLPADRFPTMSDAAAALAYFAGARQPLQYPSSMPPAPYTQPSPVTMGGAPSAPADGTSSRPWPPVEPFTEKVAQWASSVPPIGRSSLPPVSIIPRAPGAPSYPPSLLPRGLSGPPTQVSPQRTAPPAEPVEGWMRTLASGIGAPGAPPPLREPDFKAPVDVDAHLALLPPDATCKGIFFLDLVRLGATVISPSELFHLAGFPERRYVVFRDYPMAENLRLTVAVALAVYPKQPLGEGLRRIGQTAFDTVSTSLVGKTLFGVFGRDLEPLLFTGPRAYKLFLSFGEVLVEKSGPRTFRFHARAFPGFLETYQVGVVEGVLRHCGARGRLRVAIEALDRGTIELELL